MTDAPQTARLTIAPRYLLIMLLPLLVLTASEILLSAFGDTDMEPGPVAIVAAPRMAELAGRYRFMSVFFFYSAICIIFVAIFAADLRARHSMRSTAMTLCALVVVIGISLIFSTFEPAGMGSFEAYQLLGEGIFRAALGTGHLPVCQTGGPMAEACGDSGAFFAMTFLLGKTNLLSSLAVSAVIAGMVLALARSGRPDLSSPDGILREGAALQQAQSTTKRYLYCSGILLTVGMMMGLAWMNWPANLIADGGQRADYKALVDSVSLFRGVSYSVLILSYYMPVSLILMVRIERFQTAVSDASLQEIAADVKGFDIERIGSLDAFKAILSIVSPILASAIGSVVSVNPFG